MFGGLALMTCIDDCYVENFMLMTELAILGSFSLCDFKFSIYLYLQVCGKACSMEEYFKNKIM